MAALRSATQARKAGTAGVALAIAMATMAAERPAAAWTRVATSSHGTRIVVSSPSEVRTSADEGATFQAVTLPTGAGAGTADKVHSAAITDDGTLVVARANEAGAPSEAVILRPRGAAPRTLVISGEETDLPVRAFGNDVVAVIDEGSAQWSHDGGATFTQFSFPRPNAFGHGLGIHHDFTVSGGAVLFVDVSINTCRSDDFIEWQRLMRIDGASGPSASVPLVRQSAFDIERGAVVWDWSFGAYGWVYGVSNDGRAFAVSSAGAKPVPELGGGDNGRLQVAHDGRTTLAMRGTLLVDLSGPSPVVLDRAAPIVTSLAVDASGRALGVDASGAVVRFSRKGGWGRVLGP